jgi:transposase
MAKRQFELSEDEIKGLRQAEQSTRDVHELKRLQGVRLYGSGQPMGVIQAMLNCGESSVREWVQRYQTGGWTACSRSGGVAMPTS